MWSRKTFYKLMTQYKKCFCW